MIRLLFRTDEHVSDHTPISRVDDWTETILGKLVQIGEIARDRGCQAVLSGGDFFNEKSPSRISHELVTRVMEIHQGYPCPTYANVGNHDCRLSKLEFLEESPLGSLFECGVFQRCYDDHEALFEEEGLTVRVVGIPYHGRTYDMDRFRAIRKGSEDYLVVMAHLLASPVTSSMFDQEDVVLYSMLEEVCPEADVFCFGHWHKDQGVTQLKTGAYLVNVGSISRGSLRQDNLERTPKVVGLDFSRMGVQVEEIPLAVKSAEEVYDIQKRVDEEVRGLSFHLFSEALKSGFQVTGDRSIEDQIREYEDLEPKVRDRAVELLERAQFEKDGRR